MKRLGLALLLLAASACTMDMGSSTTGSSVGTDSEGHQIHIPLTYEVWKTSHYTLGNGTPACTISAGYNALTIFISRQPSGLDEAVKSNRVMQPGDELTVSIGNTNYESYETFFPRERAAKLIEAMAGGGKAYLEWSDVNAPVGRTRMHIQNILKLDDFASKLKECRAAVAAVNH